MNITSAAEASTQAVSPGLILTRCAAAAAYHTVSTRHLRLGEPSDGGRLDESFRPTTGAVEPAASDGRTRRCGLARLRRVDARGSQSPWPSPRRDAAVPAR